ncbi:site-specific integrase [Candidatus Bathyarchaeota archaeon]|nr:site-specific integrase [Candidatus Bathyarchaeota archaeon]
MFQNSSKNWNRLGNKVAERLGKPELKQIRLYDLRHFYSTMLYHKTKDTVHVQRKMGHRNIKNTLKYPNLHTPNRLKVRRVQSSNSGDCGKS